MHLELLLTTLALFSPQQQLERSPEPGLEAHRSGHLFLWADLDGDGLDDVLTRDAKGELMLLENQGAGGFVDATAGSGLGELGPVNDIGWLSARDAGRLELAVLDAEGCLHFFARGATTFTEAPGIEGIGFPVEAMTAADVDHDGRSDLFLFGGSERRLLRNLGELAFEIVDLPSGPEVSTGAVAGARPVVPEPPSTGTIEPSGARANTPRTGTRGSGATRPGSGRAPLNSTTLVTNGPGLAASTGVCVSSLDDQTGGGCLQASSTPLMGMLYPLGLDWNIDGTGQIGLGTTAPLGDVHVQDDGGTSLQASVLNSEDLIVEGSDAIVGLYSTSAGSWGSGVSLGEIDGTGSLVDKWSMTRLTTSANSSLRFTYGTNSNYASNPTRVVFEDDGGVGIGTTSANNHALRVLNSTTTGSAIDASSTQTNNPDPAVRGHHSGNQPGVEALTDGGKYAFEGNGIRVTQGNGDYALRAENNGGTAAFFDGAIQIGQPETPFFNDVARITLDRDPSNGAGRAVFRNGGQFVAEMVKIEAVKPGGSGAALSLRNGGGVAITLDADYNGSGKSRVVTDVVEITGGADLVEHFDAGEDGETIEPGTVLVIDDENPGRLEIATEPYDRRVAGVVSGAGGIAPGLSMGQEGVASGDTAVALTGRVYVKASCEAGPIRPGDRLTTSSSPGLAMRVADTSRADGAVLGKAMSALDEGTGLVLVLVNLQ